MKLEILNEKELTNVVGGGDKLDFFATGLKYGAIRGPVGVISGIKGIHDAAKLKKFVKTADRNNDFVNDICEIAEEMNLCPHAIARASGKIVGGTTTTAGACVAACGIAYGAYKLGKYVYNKIAK